MKFRKERPPKEELEHLVLQGLSLSKIGDQYGVKFGRVGHWLKTYGIKSIRHVGLNKGDKLSDEAKAQKPRLVGEKNGFYGKTHSIETKALMSKNHADFTGDKNPFRRSLDDPERREAHKERCRSIWSTRDKEWRCQFGEKLSARPLQESGAIGKIGKNHQAGYHSSTKIPSGQFWYRSSWEKLLAEKLDTMDDISSYSVENIRVKYLDGDRTRHAYCDFDIVVNDSIRIIIEVKPISVAKIKQQQIKAQMQWCFDKQVQYCILDYKMISDDLDQIIDLAKRGGLHVREYDRSGIVTAETSYEILRRRIEG